MSSLQVIFTAAMAAVSGAAVILLAFKLHKSAPPTPPEVQIRPPPPRSCIITGRKKDKEKKKKKVRFAKDVVEPSSNNDKYRKRTKSSGEMPANRVALYKGILRDRVVNTRLGMGCSY